MAAHRLTLTMIVRDEAELLPRFFHCVEGLWDELIVVDTGSTDNTVALAEGAGARVLRHVWNDHFADARNVGLAAASGEWVLFLDADEMVSPELSTQVRDLLDDPKAGAATLTMVNPLPHGNCRVNRVLRMFRNDSAIRFRYAIHEDITDAVLAMLKRDQRRLAALTGTVEHLGYVRARAAAKDKKSRDRRILEKLIGEDPEDLYSHFKLLEQDRFWHDLALWAPDASRALAQLEAAKAERVRQIHFGGDLLVLIARGLYPRGGKEVLLWLSDWMERVSPSTGLILYRAEQLEQVGDLEAARREYERCRRIGNRSGDFQLATTRPLMGLARIAWAGGDLVAAQGRVGEARTLLPTDAEALLADVVLTRIRGGEDAVRRWADHERSARGDSPELTAALAEERRLAGLKTP